MGAEPKKIAILGGLLAVAAVVFLMNRGSSDADSAPASRTVVVAPVLNAPQERGTTAPRTERRVASGRGSVTEFKPRLGPRDPKEKPDPATIDPTLRLDLLAKVQNVQMGPMVRNIFMTGPAPEVKPIVLPKVAKIAMTPPPPVPQPVPPPGPPPVPQAPPMTFKYYGFTISKASGRKSAFLLDGDDILIAAENETVKRRYRVVKIGVNSITIEDTQFKTSQTLPLQESLQG